MEICKICGREFKNIEGLNSHVGWHTNSKRPNNLEEYNKKVKDKKVKGKNHYSYGAECSEDTRKKLSESGRGRTLSEEGRKKRSKAMKRAVRNNPESYSASNVSGRTKIIEYKGFKVHGKWELEVAKWLDDQKIEWTNIIKEGFEYEWEERKRLYFPDFYLTKEDIYIEVKGYQRDQDLAKWKSVSNLLVLKKNEIEKIRNNTLGPVAQLV